MSEFPDVESFDDGWVFLLGGSNFVADHSLGFKTISDVIVKGWNDLFRKRIDVMNEIGAQYVHIVAPEKLSVYPEKTNLNIEPRDLTVNVIERGLDSEVIKKIWINPINFLCSQKEGWLVYSKSDSHWNFFGAFSAYQLIQSRLGLPFQKSILQNPKLREWTIMDLGGKFSPPVKEQVYFYKLSSNVQRSFCNELVRYKEDNSLENEQGLHIGSYVVFQNTAPLIDKKVVLFGDSFSEYRGHLLTGMLAETYREVHFVWSGNIDIPMLHKVRPDIVITEMAERFMPYNNLQDDFLLDDFVQKRLAEIG